jgi:hypothetical protein
MTFLNNEVIKNMSVCVGSIYFQSIHFAINYLDSVHQVPFTALRLPENCSFTSSNLHIFGHRKSCK